VYSGSKRAVCRCAQTEVQPGAKTGGKAGSKTGVQEGRSKGVQRCTEAETKTGF